MVLQAALATTVAAAASRARRSTWLVLSGAAAALGGGMVLRLVGNLALAVSMVAVTRPRRSRLAGAAVGGLSVQVLLRLPARGGLLPALHGASAVAAAVVIVPLMVSAYRVLGRRSRSRARAAAFALCAVVGGAGVAFGAALASSRAEAARGLDDVRVGLTMALSGDARATQAMTEAAQSLAVAHDRVTAWWAWPARVVPVLGHQVVALDAALGQAATLAAVASSATAAADLGRLVVSEGRVDLARVAAVAAPLDRITAALDTAQARLGGARSRWLLAPIGDRMDAVLGRTRRALDDARAAAAVVAVAPGLLGEGTPRRYVVAFVTPAESRGAGGYMGSFGEVTAADGRLSMTRSGRTLELIASPVEPPRPPSGPPEYLARYSRFSPETSLGDVGYSPDFPTTAQVLEEQYERAAGTAVEGAISIDPFALAALLELTGPVSVPGLDELLTAANGADLLLRQQYLRFPDPIERVDFLAAATTAVLERLTAGPLPDVRTMVKVLTPVVRQGRLMVHSARPAEQAVLASTGLDGAFPSVGSGDFFSLVTQNSANNKIDVFLRREVDYTASFEPISGRVQATVDITLSNDAPADGLPWYVIGNTNPALPVGTNRLFVSVYTPHRLESARLDGAPLAMEADRELGRYVYSAFVTLSAGQQGVVRLRLAGRVAGGGTYRIGYSPQPLVNPDRVQFRLELPAGWRLDGGPFRARGPGAVTSVPPDHDVVLTASLRRR